MASIAQVRDFFSYQLAIEYIEELYQSDSSDIPVQLDRYQKIIRKYEEIFSGNQGVVICSAPGRTEIGGNHTDHENGCVLAAGVHLDTVGVAARNEGDTIRIFSDGYPGIEISLNNLEPQIEEINTSNALLRGICMYIVRDGKKIGGFDAAINSIVPEGSGLSSSASFEMLVGHIINILFNDGNIPPMKLAKAGHFAETIYYKKPCGMMDQVTSALGGMVMIDFLRPAKPIVRKIGFELSSSAHRLVITNTGGNHANLSDDYASITDDNHEVARYFGKSELRGVNEKEFRSSIPEIRKAVNDRSILRAMHFFDDNRRVREEVEALESGNFEQFLALVKESGVSSWTLLQNCYSLKYPKEQGIPLALAISAQLLRGNGASRVHGGGFAGTIQAFVPNHMVNEYISGMENVFGKGACLRVNIRPVGITRIPIPE